MNREWTDEELEILRRDRAARIPVPVTAAKLGRPVPATYLRARLIGSLVQPHQSWDEDSVSRLRNLVMADPPMTDKQIAAELGRTVSQIRWKMKDLELTGVRDLSKLARVTSSQAASAQRKAREPVPSQVPTPRPRLQPQAPAKASPPSPHYTPLELALKRLETQLKARLKEAIADAEFGMVQAAREAIAEKARIDQRLSKLGARAAKVETRTKAARKTDKAAPAARTKDALPRKSAARTVMPALPTARRQNAQPPAPPPPPPPRIVVVETPVAARPPSPEPAPAQLSGRGGWKSVRKDPARVAAQARAKATTRADSVDLAQAAQAAIERFIAERGVTRAANETSQTLVSRLQARGYVVVREGDGWLIDQRHRIANEQDLIAFADARGISPEIAA